MHTAIYLTNRLLVHMATSPHTQRDCLLLHLSSQQAGRCTLNCKSHNVIIMHNAIRGVTAISYCCCTHTCIIRNRKRSEKSYGSASGDVRSHVFSTRNTIKTRVFQSIMKLKFFGNFCYFLYKESRMCQTENKT